MAYVARRWADDKRLSSPRLSFPMSTHYRLRVLRLEELKWNQRLHSKTPNLYVQAKHGDIVRTTRTIKKGLSPVWDEELVFFSAADADTFEIQVKHDSLYLPDPRVGAVDIKLTDLLTKSTNGEAPFCLSSSDGTSATMCPGIIILHLKASDTMSAADTDIKGVWEDIRLRKVQRLEGDFDVTQSTNGAMTRLSIQSDLYTSVEHLLSKLEVFKRVIDALSEIHPFLTIAWNLTSVLYKAVKGVFDTDQRIINLVQMMGDAFAFVRDVQTLRDKAKSLQEPINGLLKQTIECCLFVSYYARRSFFRRMLDPSSSQKIDEFEQVLASFKQQIDSGVALHTAFVSMRTSQGIDDILLAQRLHPSPMDGFHRRNCLAGTRIEIRSQIIDWMFSETKQNIFWLYGVAGSGKSTVSTTIANHFREMSRLGAFLFFERGKSEPSSVIRTIAYKLALFDSSIGSGILSEIENDKDIATASPLHQFNKLLLQPLLTLESPPTAPVVIVLDALDECGTPETRRGLMELFRQEFPKLPNTFRFLITSRQEADIDRALVLHPEKVCMIELVCTTAASQRDVLSYLRSEMHSIVQEQVIIPEEWPWDENMELLGKAANGLFVWAATAVKMVKNGTFKFGRLERLVSDSKSLPGFGLDELYSSILRNSDIEWNDEESKEAFVKILALLLLCKVPLSIKDVDSLLGFPPHRSSIEILSSLRSVLTYSPGGPVNLLHSSFSDYLMSPERSKDPWFIDISAAKTFIVTRCFTVMAKLLCFNICALQTSFVRNDDVPDLSDLIKSRIPSYLQYACLHWVQHLIEVPYSLRLVEMLSNFAYHHLLFWFEVLSLIGEFGRVATRALPDASLWAEPRDATLALFLRDANKLATLFASPVVQSSPHIYVSMVPLSKGDSKVAEHYSKYLSAMVRVERRGMKTLSSCLKVLEGHEYVVSTVAFSPNRRLIASASYDGAVTLWNVDNGEGIVIPPGGNTLCFSPDGNRIVLGSRERMIRVWDIQNEKLILGPLEWHTADVWSVAWSPDGTRIGSGSTDMMVVIWDAAVGKPLFSPLTGHTDQVTSVAFSPDSLHLASGAFDNTIRIWDVKGGKLAFKPFEGHSDAVQSVAFSPNGEHLVSGSCDQTIKVWEVASGSIISTFRGHMSDVLSVAYSPCGTRIVSGSWDRTLIVWDSGSGTILSGPLVGHESHVNSVAFSPDGKYIVSGSKDKTVRVWDATAAASNSKTPARHTRAVTSVAYTPDGSNIASASLDQSIILWDAQSGNVVVGPLLGHTDVITCVAFSLDGSRLVSGSEDKTIRVWSREYGEIVSVSLEGHTDIVTCIDISPDNVTIASGSSDGTIRVWNMVTGTLVAGPVHVHSDWVRSIVFSPNGKQLASGSDDKTVRIWNTETWDAIFEPLVAHSWYVSSVRFSPDGSWIASGSWDTTIMIWNSRSGRRVVGPLRGHSSPVQCVIFSLDGRHLISGSWDSTIRVWNMESGQSICELVGHTNGVTSLALSPDWSRIISGSEDTTIRIWDTSNLFESSREYTAPESSSPSNRYFSKWVLQKDGWIMGGSERRDFLMWIPPDLRSTLLRHRNMAILSCDFVTELDFTGAALGERWAECFASSL